MDLKKYHKSLKLLIKICDVEYFFMFLLHMIL